MSSTVSRRTLLGGAAAALGVAATAPLAPLGGFAAYAGPTRTVTGPYGALRAPDANGLRLPPGFTSRVIGRAGQPVLGQPVGSVPWHAFPDGAGTFATPDGGWILVSNSENPPPTDIPGLATIGDGLGRVTAVRFRPNGAIASVRTILGPEVGARSLCAGGPTPWGTWLACEEYEEAATPLTPFRAGRVFECDPTGARAPVVRPAMGLFKHEMAACDPDRGRIYLSEDQDDGFLYRFTPKTWGDLRKGTLEAARVRDGVVDWIKVPDPSAATTPLRYQVRATPFAGGEGVLYRDGVVYLATKGDSRIWAVRPAERTIEELYDPADVTSPVLNGVDNLHMHPGGILYVAEDGDDMQVVGITPDRRLFAFCQATGPEHGVQSGSPIPTTSEITGIAFAPRGDRMYLSSQRGAGLGITYEVRGPF